MLLRQTGRLVLIATAALQYKRFQLLSSSNITSVGDKERSCPKALEPVLETLACVEAEDEECASAGYNNAEFKKLHNGVDTNTIIDETFWPTAFALVDIGINIKSKRQRRGKVLLRYVKNVTTSSGAEFGLPSSTEYPFSQTFLQHEQVSVSVDEDCKIVLWDQEGDDTEQKDLEDALNAVIFEVGRSWLARLLWLAAAALVVIRFIVLPLLKLVQDGISYLRGGGIYQILHWVFQNLAMPWWYWFPEPIGLLPVIVHRGLLNAYNLHPAPLPPQTPGPDPKGRAPDGRGTDKENPDAAATGSPFGRNCSTLPEHLRNTTGEPNVQLIAQKLLHRNNGLKPAGMQLNVIAAAWIQAMVHDWVGHVDDEKSPDIVLSKGEENGCPLKSFAFKKTLERKDGEFDSFRTQWWDASFVYGQTEAAVKRARTFKNGMLKTNSKNPDTLPVEPNGTTSLGDNKNSWVGVALLQELFVKEHNAIAKKIAESHPEIAGNDEELFTKARLVISAIVAKIHTIDWTCELLKSTTLKVGMWTNWFGLPIGLGLPKWLPLPPIFRLTEKEKADNKGVPFCLTEEFVGVYRLHPLLPDRLIIGPNMDSLPLEELVGEKGEKAMRAKPERPSHFWEAAVKYPCGNLGPHNYPSALRDLSPTDEDGKNLPKARNVDLAALDLYRDRERGIPRFNQFRRDLSLKPYKSYEQLTGGNKALAKELEDVYGVNGIDNVDLLVGDLYEFKIPGQNFAISYTSFIIFLLMASRRLDADPFLNEYFNEEYYSEAGIEWVRSTMGLRDVLGRHYPDIVRDCVTKEGSKSAFTPTVKWPLEDTFPEAVAAAKKVQ